MAFHSDSQIAVTCCSREFDIYIDGWFILFSPTIIQSAIIIYILLLRFIHLISPAATITTEKEPSITRVYVCVCVLKTASDQITISRESVSSSRRGENFKESDLSEVS